MWERIYTSSLTIAAQTPRPKPVISIVSPRSWQPAWIQSKVRELKMPENSFQDKAPSGRIRVTVRPMTTPWALTEVFWVAMDASRVASRGACCAWLCERLESGSGDAVQIVKRVQTTKKTMLVEAEDVIVAFSQRRNRNVTQ